MKIQFFLYNPKEQIENVYVRIADSKRYDVKVKTPICVYSDCFKNGSIKIPKIASKEKIEDCKKKQEQINSLNSHLFSTLAECKTLKTKEAKEIVNSFVYGLIQTKESQKIIELYEDCLKDRELAKSTFKKLSVLKNHIRQFEEENEISVTLDNFTHSMVESILDSVKNGERGTNTAVNYYKSMRAFCSWLYEKNYTTENVYKGIEMPAEKYGTPFYLTQEERNQLANAKMPHFVGVQRDIFIFQCLIGCRVADLLQLTKSNINNGFVEYIADKTLKNPKIIKVPLNEQAKKLIAKYNNPDSDFLFPFISQQKYNEQIKHAAKLAGLNRQIQKFNTKTGKKEFAPLYEVISSHCARRTFIGILYKKTKDVNVIASMSGHVENSKAFTRYRAIDDEDKKELIDLL